MREEVMAEIIGIVFGNGSVCRHDYEIRISLGKRDKEYANIITRKLRRLQVMPKMEVKQTNEIWIRVWSKAFWKAICKWFKPGRKHLKKLPKNMPAFIRGVFDTDGSVHIDKGVYPVITIRNRNRKVLMEIRKFLQKNGITASVFGPELTEFGGKVYKLRVYGKRNCLKWLRLIGSSNPRKRRILENALRFGQTVRGESWGRKGD